MFTICLKGVIDMHNIKDFGAVGDGITVNTNAIQRAIDAGGTVYIPSGVYVTGTLYLKSHGGLFLAPGAVLKASTNRNDYNEADFCPQNSVIASEFMVGTHLITAVEQEDIFIDGEGCIDGNSHYWVNESLKYDSCDFYGHPPMSANRPGQMIFFAECKNVRVKNVKLLYSPFWHLFLYGCEDVFIRGLYINGETKQWVNDGIDIDCCKNVTVSDCIIVTGDDGITLRASGKRLVKGEEVCENVTVSNCIITSYLDYGIRIGVGNGIIRNCIFSNIIIKDSLNGIGVTCRFAPQGNCTKVENIIFNGLQIQALRALLIKISDFQDHPPLKEFSYIKGLYFNNSIFKSNRSNYLFGFDNSEVSDIVFNNTHFTVLEESRDNNRYINGRWDIKEKNSAIFMSKISKAVFNGCSFSRAGSEKFILDIKKENGSNVELHNTQCSIE
jgi:polygalacturonase